MHAILDSQVKLVLGHWVPVLSFFMLYYLPGGIWHSSVFGGWHFNAHEHNHVHFFLECREHGENITNDNCWGVGDLWSGLVGGIKRVVGCHTNYSMHSTARCIF